MDGVCYLRHQPGRFLRLPNRFYRVRIVGIDNFALDSNTFNQPLPLEASPAGEQRRERLTAPTDGVELDQEQLDWLREGLVASWATPEVRGRILVLHHPPSVTEASKWDQGQTLAVRHQLRPVLDQVAARVGSPARGRPLVDLGISGQAHCLESIETADTGHGDAWMPWLICAGRGNSLRRQRPEGPSLGECGEMGVRTIARSQLFVGRSGRGSRLRRPYSGLRVECGRRPPTAPAPHPLVAEKVEGTWRPYDLETIRVAEYRSGG
ncbi:MAG: hypothetical protein ACKO7Z_01255 [Cyanobacteriota bacterium]